MLPILEFKHGNIAEVYSTDFHKLRQAYRYGCMDCSKYSAVVRYIQIIEEGGDFCLIFFFEIKS